MLNQLVSLIPTLIDIAGFSLALYLLSKKLNWKKRWKAWIPGLRMYCLGESLRQDEEGIVCGILDIGYVLILVLRALIPANEYGTAILGLLQLVAFVFLFIYRIKLFLEILKAFEKSKVWILLYLICDWLPVLILGIFRKYQPTPEKIREESWKAGSAPKHTGNVICDTVPETNEGLSVHIRERTARDFGRKRYLLKDIAMNIPKKNLVMLLGGSGAGKTTMINALIGYEKADATILLNGVDIYNDYESVKHKIGFVTQQNLIRGKDTVIRTIGDAARIRLPKSMSREDKKRRISEVLSLLGLSAGQEGLVSKKSGGQLRRICIAMELVTDPDLFVLDEPDSGLDGAIAREIIAKLRQIADEDRIVVVITHTPDRVVDYFDKVIVLARDSSRVGRLAFYGSPQEAREFFRKDTMEEIVMHVNGKEDGGEGCADEMIEKYAAKIVSEAAAEGAVKEDITEAKVISIEESLEGNADQACRKFERKTQRKRRH